jgi:signal transduction histidine kinase
MQHTLSFVNLWHQIAATIATLSDLDPVLMEIAAATREAFQAEGCLLTLAIAPAGHSASAELPSTARKVCWLVGSQTPVLTAEQPLNWEPLIHGDRVIVVNDLAAAPRQPAPSSRSLLELWQSSLQAPDQPALQVRAVLGACVHLQGAITCLVSLINSLPHEWNQAEKEGLEMVAHQVAIALSQRQLQQHLSRQLEYQRVVNQLTLAIRNSSELNEVLKLAVSGATKVLQVQRGLLLRLKYEDPLFRSRSQDQIPRVRVTVASEWIQDVPFGLDAWQSAAASEWHPSSGLNQALWMSDCELCQRAFLNPTSPIVVRDPHELQQADLKSVAPLFNLDQLPTLLMVPLESQGTILGFLVFQHPQAHDWQPEELELVELVGAQVSTAIIQTETLRQVQALVEKRTAELRESLAVQAKLYERTRQQVDQLRHLNQLKDEFLSTVSHELRTPLTSMTMAIRMLRQVGTSSDRSTRYLDILEQQCAQETSLINDLLDLQELESKQVQVQPQEIVMGDLVNELVESFQPRWAAKGLTIRVDLPKKPLRLRSDRDSLSRILLELLTNAGKYSEPNNGITLTIKHRVTDTVNEVILSLSNLGSGIPPEELPYIFEKFRRGQGATQNAVQGTGLGLALVKSLVQHVGGTITVSSDPTDDNSIWETCFTLTLPQITDSSKL